MNVIVVLLVALICSQVRGRKHVMRFSVNPTIILAQPFRHCSVLSDCAQKFLDAACANSFARCNTHESEKEREREEQEEESVAINISRLSGLLKTLSL